MREGEENREEGNSEASREVGRGEDWRRGKGKKRREEISAKMEERRGEERREEETKEGRGWTGDNV